MKKMHFILLLWLSLSAYSIGADLKSSTVETAERLANELAQKLSGLGSFQAEYQALAPGKSTEITIILDKSRKYCLVKIVMAGTDNEGLYFASDFSRANEKDGGFQLLVINGKKGKRFSLSFKELIERLDNPLGVFFSMAKQCSETKKDFDEICVHSSIPSLSLGLSESNLTLSLGVCTGSNSPAASWLSRDTITNITKVIESPGSIEFAYKDNHIVSVDRETGLLLKDCYPNPADPGRREIVLKEHSALEQDLPYSALIPWFASIIMEDMISKEMYEQISVAWLTELGRKLSSDEKLDENLRIHSAAITAAARRAGREMIREKAKTIAQEFATKEKATLVLKKCLIPMYEKYQKDRPEKAHNLSFNKFLDLLTAYGDTNTTAVLSADSDDSKTFINQLAETQEKKCEAEIARLPEDAQEGLRKLYAISIPALSEGFVEELYSRLCLAILDQAKSVYADNLTNDKNVPNQPDASDGK